MNTVRFLYYCYKAWQSTDKLAYWVVKDRFGVPQVSIAIGKGREAWRVNQFAVESLTRF